MRKRVLFLLVAVAACYSLNQFAPLRSAQAQSRTRGAKQAHYQALWHWLKQVDYTKWPGIDGASPALVEGQSPHGAFIKTYISPKAATNTTNPPSGSVIVKENYSPEQKLMAITVMHRSKGYDPEHGDWYYAKYLTDGKIARTPPEMKNMPIAGKFKKCIACHQGADGNDYLFIND